MYSPSACWEPAASKKPVAYSAHMLPPKMAAVSAQRNIFSGLFSIKAPAFRSFFV